MKICTKCQVPKPLSDFYRSMRSADGHRWGCKSCDNKASVSWQKAHPQEASKFSSAWKKKNPEKAKQADRKWQLEHPERRREIARNWVRNNPEKSQANSLKWKEANPDRHLANTRNHRKNNRDKYIQYDHNRRARELGNGGEWTDAEWADLKTKYGFRCLGCNRQEPVVKLSPDHVVPLKKGGRNDIGNIQPLCCEINGSKKGACQYRKSTKIIDYRKEAA